MTRPVPVPESASLERRFSTVFGGATAEFVIRAPGRANLIGEHIDYNGLAVLPIAVDRHIMVLVSARTDSRVRAHNDDPRFEPVAFDMAGEVSPGPPGDWGNYVKAAASSLAGRGPGLLGADLLVASDLPLAAGLSSSSALVVAVALALLSVNGLQEDPLALAEQMADAERFVGVRGGGMDQAICLTGRAGCASLIDFAPLRVAHHPIPPDWGFVVAYSLVPAEKSAGARAVYNQRTEECRLAMLEVARALGLEGEERSYPAMRRLFGTDELMAAGEMSLTPELLPRFRHVISEGARVDRAVEALDTRDLPGFGGLLDASHASLRDDYDVSCAAVDDLVAAALAGGAAGARLTGAGLGGSIVALGPIGATADIIAALDERFYAGRTTTVDDRIRFAARPGGGATVVGVVLRP